MTEAELKAEYRKVRERLMSGKPVNKSGGVVNEHPARDRMHKLLGRAKDVPQARVPIQFFLADIDDPLLPAWKRIALQTCQQHGIMFNELMAHRRCRHIVAVRHEVMWRLAIETDMSLTAIGRRLNRDHTSVLHGIRAHAARNGVYNPFPYLGRDALGRLSRAKAPMEAIHA